jgi:AhpD family alkylhydroperoxidase
MPLVDPPESIRWWLRPGLWLARRFTGKDPLPARLLAHAPKAAIGFGIFELTAAHAPADLDARSLAAARIVASTIAGCPFCIDMIAATWRSAGFSVDELGALFADASRADGLFSALEPRARAAARYAVVLTATPVHVPDDVAQALRAVFDAREIVVLSAAIAQVNAWARFNHGLGVPAAGFFDERACPVKLPVGH